jgi:hypothetical protein
MSGAYVFGKEDASEDASDQTEYDYRQIDSFETLLKNVNLLRALGGFVEEFGNLSGYDRKFLDYFEGLRDMIFVGNLDVYTDGWDDHLREVVNGKILSGGGKRNQTKSKRIQVKHKRKRLTKKT